MNSILNETATMKVGRKILAGVRLTKSRNGCLRATGIDPYGHLLQTVLGKRKRHTVTLKTKERALHCEFEWRTYLQEGEFAGSGTFTASILPKRWRYFGERRWRRWVGKK